MEEKKLTDEEIVKAIKDCLKDKIPCDKCKVYNKNKPMLSERFIVCKKLIKNLYDLIRRQKAEIERLTDTLNQYMSGELVNEDIFVQQVKDIQQAEKDTAKEIFEAIFNDCWAIKDENGQRIFVESIIRHIAKERYGVEVE